MAGTQRCARPGCSGLATAWLSYDYAGQRVWLDDSDADTGGHHSALCTAHAGRLRPPKGWSFHDRRTARSNATPPPTPSSSGPPGHQAPPGRQAPPAIAV